MAEPETLLWSRRTFAGASGMMLVSGLLGTTAKAAPGKRSEWVTLSFDDASLHAFRVADMGAMEKATVVIAHGLRGLDAATRRLCVRLADAGYYAIAPDLYRSVGVEVSQDGMIARQKLHRLNDHMLGKMLSASAGFAAQERHITKASPLFLTMSADGQSFTKSTDPGFARVSSLAMPSAGSREWVQLTDWIDA